MGEGKDAPLVGPDSNEQIIKLRQHRALLLAMETVGWLHMLGKAKRAFLDFHTGIHPGAPSSYRYQDWYADPVLPFVWDDVLGWVRTRYGTIPGLATPSVLLTGHMERSGKGPLGLLQAAHGMASGVEKNVPGETSKYLGQKAPEVWLTSAFGAPVRNLLTDPPVVLAAEGWKALVNEAARVLSELKALGTAGGSTVEQWISWRDRAIGVNSLIRKSLLSTLAETRLPNNDVTLWDQSYVAAALFKSAMAGAVLTDPGFQWGSTSLKNVTRWRLLAVGIGTDHYEQRAVRIGDWVGARADIKRLLDGVCQLVEVDLAAGSVVYRDSSMCVFTFPGEPSDGQVSAVRPQDLVPWAQKNVDALAQKLRLETPPKCLLSEPTRAFGPMVETIDAIRKALAVPVHRVWSIAGDDVARGHVCPVCLVRCSGDPSHKEQPCRECRDRRKGRLEDWLNHRLSRDTIWLNEVADGNDRLALITMSLDIEPWLSGSRLDSLRTQAIAEWVCENPTLNKQENPIDVTQPFSSLTGYVRREMSSRAFHQQDRVLLNLQDGFSRAASWRSFYGDIVEDRSDAPAWEKPNDVELHARWVAHQLFRKLASPGRVYRFWRQAEEYFDGLLDAFRQVAASHASPWRVKRLALTPDLTSPNTGWQDREGYSGQLGGEVFSALYRRDRDDFLTTCNVARLLKMHDKLAALAGKSLRLRSDRGAVTALTIKEARAEATLLGNYRPVIPLEVSPLRFRVLVPLEAASACLDRAIAGWDKQFGRVWDRLPLRAGVIAFEEKLPFQAVIEAARVMEEDLAAVGDEPWRVLNNVEQDNDRVITFSRRDGGTEQRRMAVTLRGGRSDVFYPYLAVNATAPSFPLDFLDPSGQAYRHAQDLQQGDEVTVYPSRVATTFLESASDRFVPVDVRPLSAWQRMNEVWRLLDKAAPSTEAVRGVWSVLLARQQSWKDADGRWLSGGEAAWLGLARAALATQLNVSGETLDKLSAAVGDGSFGWTLNWRMSVLKERMGRANNG